MTEEHTFRVSELGEEIRLFLAEAFPGVWVSGEVQRLRDSRNGHLYFELVEKGDGDAVVGKLESVLWRRDRRRVERELAATGLALAEGLEIRCRGRVDFYPAGGRLQLQVREVDPVFSLGLLARRRQETLAALAALGLLERNRLLPLSPLPLRLGLVTSHGSAAYHDFIATLRESGYPFEVLLVHATVQGREAERQVVSALRLVAARGVDCAVLVRGGGARSDLAAFDSRAIAEAIATLGVPVITGLGHEIDESVADLVAHTACKTPTKVAELLVQRVESAEVLLDRACEQLERLCLETLRRGRETIGRAEQRLLQAGARLDREQRRLAEAARMLVTIAGLRLRRERTRLGEWGWRLTAASPRGVERWRRRHVDLARGLAVASRGRLREADHRCQGLERLSAQLDPRRVLARGFSITRQGDGTVVRRPRQVAAGERIRTQLAGGELVSITEKAAMAEGETMRPQPGAEIGRQAPLFPDREERSTT